MVLARPSLRWAWLGALACFLVAAATGALLRFSMLYGAPGGLQLHNLRHAHSHLMYFGWATPALMALIAANLPHVSGRPAGTGAGRVLGVTFVVALLAYAAFLQYGYQPAQIGDVALPLSTIGAGLNVVAWYGFVAFYWRETRGVARFMALRLWDAALVFLVLSSLGAWGLALAAVADANTPLLSLALTHLFLDLFANGWFMLGLLGIAFLSFPAAASGRAARIGENLLVIGLPLTFLLSLPGGSLPAAVRFLAGMSAVLAATGLLALLLALIRAHSGVIDGAQRWLWASAFFFLAMKAGAFLIVSFPAGAVWSARMGLRISYLHWLLLGGISIGLFAAARAHWGSVAVAAWRSLLFTIVVLLLSLIPMTRLWPSSLGGRWTLVMAAWVALGPVVVALYVFVKARRDAGSAALGSPTADVSLSTRQ